MILLLDLRTAHLSFTVYMTDFDFMLALNSVGIEQRAEQSGLFFHLRLCLLRPDKIFFVKNLPVVQWDQLSLDLCPTRCVPGVQWAFFFLS